VHDLKTGVSFARRDEAGAAGESSDQALIRAGAAYRCWNVVRELDLFERAILVHEGTRFGERAVSACDRVSHDQV
jgi:hypothetical protein